jgi:hypothetical protein
MLRSVVHHVRDDQPTRNHVVRVLAQRHRLGQCRVVEGLRIPAEAGVLFEAEGVEGREVVELEPMVPHVRIPDVVPDAELAPAPVDVDEVSERLEGAAVVEDRRLLEFRIGEAGRRRQDAIVRRRVEAHEREQAIAIHRSSS